MRLGEIYLSLGPLDVLDPDLVPQVDAADDQRGYHGLAEASVEQLLPLGQGQVGGLLQFQWGN